MLSQTRFSLRGFETSESALMITLTSSFDVSAKLIASEFNHFMVYLKRYLKDNKLEYICVRETTKRGVFHYHLVLFHYNFIPFYDLCKMWRLGFLWISLGSGSEGVSYITKYIKKGWGVEYVRLHSSYSFLAFAKSEYLKWRAAWRKIYFFGIYADKLLAQGFDNFKYIKSRFEYDYAKTLGFRKCQVYI